MSETLTTTGSGLPSALSPRTCPSVPSFSCQTEVLGGLLAEGRGSSSSLSHPATALPGEEWTSKKQMETSEFLMRWICELHVRACLKTTRHKAEASGQRRILLL